LEEEDK
jgi:hypothetical protein